MPPEAVPVWPLGAALGEGPVWVERDRALWFVDIKAPAIHRLDPATGDRASWPAPEQVGFVLPAADGGFVAGLQSGLHWFNPADGRFAPLIGVEPELPGNRLNDATVDPLGRLWFGSMDDGCSAPTGALYRLGADGNVARAGPTCAITNGPAVSPDARTLYHVDTVAGTIHAHAIDGDGALDAGRVFATIDPADGNPDGASIDAGGGVWVGIWGGAQARRYMPDGTLDRVVRFPTDNVTKVAIGGPDRLTAYATTARGDLTPEQLAEQPLAGALFSFRADVPGLPGVEIAVGIA